MVTSYGVSNSSHQKSKNLRLTVLVFICISEITTLLLKKIHLYFHSDTLDSGTTTETSTDTDTDTDIEIGQYRYRQTQKWTQTQTHRKTYTDIQRKIHRCKGEKD